MGSIQSSINSMLGTAAAGAIAIKHFRTKNVKAQQAQQQAAVKASKQMQAAQKAKQSVQDAIQSKQAQKRNFMEYLKNENSSLGPIGQLDPGLQAKIAAQYTPAMRRQLMDRVDKERNSNGKHK